MRNSLSHVLICYGQLYRGIAINLTVIYGHLNMLNIALLKKMWGYLYMYVWSSLTWWRREGKRWHMSKAQAPQPI